MAVTRCDAGGGVLAGADASWDIALAVVVVSPAGDRAVREDCDGVEVARGDAHDGVLGGADAAWDIALAVVVPSPAEDRAVRQQRHGVVVADINFSNFHCLLLILGQVQKVKARWDSIPTFPPSRRILS